MEDTKTFNQLYALIENFSLNHPSINSFDIGKELELDIDKFEWFPKLFVITGPANMNRGSIIASFSVLIIDKEGSLSDMLQVCFDFVAQMKYNGLLTDGVSFEPLTNIHDNVLTGWRFNIDLNTSMLSRCVKPYVEVQTFDYEFDFEL